MKRKQMLAWLMTAVMTVSAMPVPSLAETISESSTVTEERTAEQKQQTDNGNPAEESGQTKANEEHAEESGQTKENEEHAEESEQTKENEEHAEESEETKENEEHAEENEQTKENEEHAEESEQTKENEEYAEKEEQPEENQPEVPTVNEVVETEQVKLYLAAVAALPEQITEENIEEVFRQVQESCPEIYEQLSAEEKAMEAVRAAYVRWQEIAEKVNSFYGITTVAESNVAYRDGTYEGIGKGKRGAIKLEVTIADGKIISIKALETKEDESLWERAIQLFDEIIKKQSTDVDVITQATISSNGIKEAVQNALDQAIDSGIFAGGDGSVDNPYQIENASQLAAFALSVDKCQTYEGEYISLNNDIDLSGFDNWNPIGDEGISDNHLESLFNGHFNGQGYTISGMSISGHYQEEVSLGLFSTLNNKAVVEGVNVVDAKINATGDAPIRAGIITGDTVKSEKKSDGNYEVGTRVDFCRTEGSIEVSSNNPKLVWGGGITARAGIGTVITNCVADVNIKAQSKGGSQSAYAGGIAATTGRDVLLVNCASFGDLYASSPLSTNFGGMAGGIAGMLGGKQYNCYASGNITIGNGGTDHLWIGTLYGQITTAGMKADNNREYAYPETGALRAYGYYAENMTLKQETYQGKDQLQEIKEISPLQEKGYSNRISTDQIFKAETVTTEKMQTQEFADMLNQNLPDIARILEAYDFDEISLKKWELSSGKVQPSNLEWHYEDIDSSIFAGGDGSEEAPYLIRTSEQMRAFARSLTSTLDYTGKYIALDQNLDLSDGEWMPIGGSQYPFNGVFDGQGHVICGLKIGSAESPKTLDSQNIYIGLFGVLNEGAVVKNVVLEDVHFYTSYNATACVGGIAGGMQGSQDTSNYKGAVIDSCTVSGEMVHTASKGNQFVGGIAAMQYKGAVINCKSTVRLSGTVKDSSLAEVGGLVALNNRGLVANSYAVKVNIYGSGSRQNGNEGMAVVSGLVAVNAGSLVNCYTSGRLVTGEYSTYAGMVSGWVTGIGKSYQCWYDEASEMLIEQQVVKPVESIGTKVPSGVNDEGDAYTGGLVDAIKGYIAQSYSALSDELNNNFLKFSVDITQYGLNPMALKAWTYVPDTKDVTLTESYLTAQYVRPEIEKVKAEEPQLLNGIWYGRDEAKTTVVQLNVQDGTVTAIKVLSGESNGIAYEAAVSKAKKKAIYGDITGYGMGDASMFDGGDGSKQSPYLISTETQLRYLASSINADESWEDKWFALTQDIDLSQKEWLPIGWGIKAEVKGKGAVVAAYPFRGNFDGRNHTISHLTMGTSEKSADCYTAALFGLTDGEYTSNAPVSELNGARAVYIKNIYLRDIMIDTKTRYENYVGGLLGSGQNGIYVDNCSVTGTIHAETTESFCRAGGIAANVLRGAVTNTWADVAVSAVTDSSNVYAGGMFALTNRVTVINCYALGNVTGNAANNNKVHIGGLTGQAGGVQINCYATGDVISLKTTTDVGGINGRMGAIAADVHCYFNKEAKQIIAGTLNTDNVATGVNANNQALVIDSIGKTREELTSQAFADLLNVNRIQCNNDLQTVHEFLKKATLKQNIYFEGSASDLKKWKLDEKVEFDEIEKNKGNIEVRNQIIGGTISVDKMTAVVGEKVTIKVMPEAGYQLTSIGYCPIDAEGKKGSLEVIKPDELGDYTFIMPDANILVGAAFQNDPMLINKKIGGSKESDWKAYAAIKDAFIYESDDGTKARVIIDKRFFEVQDMSMTLELRQYNEAGYKVVGSRTYNHDEMIALYENQSGDWVTLENVEFLKLLDQKFEPGKSIYCVVKFSRPCWVDAIGNPVYRWTYTEDAKILEDGKVKPAPIIWLYHLNENTYRGSKVRSILRALNIPCATIDATNLNQNIGYLVGWEGYQAVENPNSEQNFDVEYILMGNLTEVQMDDFLEGMSESNIRVNLKSVPTAWTASKSFSELFAIMASEDAAFKEILKLDTMIYDAKALTEEQYGQSQNWQLLKDALQKAMALLEADQEAKTEEYAKAYENLLEAYLKVTQKQLLNGDLEINLQLQPNGKYSLTAHLNTSLEQPDFTCEWQDHSTGNTLKDVDQNQLYKVNVKITGRNRYYGQLSEKLYVPTAPKAVAIARENRIDIVFDKIEAAFNSPAPIGYTAQLYENNEPIKTLTIEEAGALTFEGLKSNTTYSVKVYAYNIVGRSDMEEVQVITKSSSSTKKTSSKKSSAKKSTAPELKNNEEPNKTIETSKLSEEKNQKDMYQEAIQWAMKQEITKVEHPEDFLPEKVCDRAQIVTFLWRAAGSPKVSKPNTFVDIDKKAYYYDAVLWAVSQGITNGTGKNTFDPHLSITKGQAITLVWRAVGSEKADSTDTFKDVSRTSYAYQAVLWGITQKIVSANNKDTFGLEEPYTREEMIILLWQYSQSKK